jgi:hypothetical protein
MLQNLKQDAGGCMGKKSREKRERRERADARNAAASLLKQMQEFRDSRGTGTGSAGASPLCLFDGRTLMVPNPLEVLKVPEH